MPTTTSKTKLRTAGDIISRMRYSKEEDCASLLMGYDDRINGPMEKSIADYKSVDEGGDIPQHRIQYFRRSLVPDSAQTMNESLLWDRAGRIDRIFGSGLGKDAPASCETIQRAFDAIANMQRIAEEKEICRQEKAKQRARKQQAKARLNQGANKASSTKAEVETDGAPSYFRYQWSKVNCFEFDTDAAAWVIRTPTKQNKQKRADQKLRIVTWNVLFDVFDKEVSLFEGDNSLDRWTLLLELLADTDADLISLQEVTPAFVKLLCESSWAQERYSISSTVGNCGTVEPHGNMLLWKRTSLEVALPGMGLTVLNDGLRQRSIVACLRTISDPDTVLLCAAVHLPCDVAAESPNGRSRATARRRELNTVIGKLETLEQQLGRQKSVKSVVPIILGDFNADEKDHELQNGGLLSPSLNKAEGIFLDAWQLINNDLPGYTFNPETNARARVISKKGPRRIDRILVGRGINESSFALCPVEGQLLGEAPLGTAPPSDHYGLSILFATKKNDSPSPNNKRLQSQNAWASTALPTFDTLLALTLDDSKIGAATLFDPDSSLPVPHITLLNGFAELLSQESHDIAVQNMTSTVADILEATQTSKIPFHRDCLKVFEHRASAALVCTPDSSDWLQALYGALRSKFRFCDEQESRFAEGWSSHVTIQKFATVEAARAEASRIESADDWIHGVRLRAQAVVLYQRDPNDRKFYACAATPLFAPPGDIRSCAPQTFLRDAGASMSSYFAKQSHPFVSNIERVCQTTIAAMGGHFQAKLSRYGSCQFNASLPGISDIDAVVELLPKNLPGHSNDQAVISVSAFLHGVSARLKSIHSSAKIRTRIAGANGVALHFLTAKLCPSAPSVDLMIRVRDAHGKPVDSTGLAASESMEDGKIIIEELGRFKASSRCRIIEIFEAALRLCKLWAYRRQIYGSSLGFLGGGAWAILLARALAKGIREETILLVNDMGAEIPMEAAGIQVLAYFFKEMARSWGRALFVFPERENDLGTAKSDQPVEKLTERAIGRGTLAILAPSSKNDFARNLTRSTAEVILKEISRANALLDGKGLIDNVFLPIQEGEFFSSGDSVLFLEIDVQKLVAPCLPEVKGWGGCQMLRTLVSLESEVAATKIRCFSRPLRLKGRLLFLVQVDSADEDLVSFLHKRRQSLEHDSKSFFNDCLTKNVGEVPVVLRCLSSRHFREAFS